MASPKPLPARQPTCSRVRLRNAGAALLRLPKILIPPQNFSSLFRRDSLPRGRPRLRCCTKPAPHPARTLSLPRFFLHSAAALLLAPSLRAAEPPYRLTYPSSAVPDTDFYGKDSVLASGLDLDGDRRVGLMSAVRYAQNVKRGRCGCFSAWATAASAAPARGSGTAEAAYSAAAS